MKKPLISIVVPIYNVEPYLPRCIDSIISQTYQNLEIILVDDGSPDRCGEICDGYAKCDERIKVIHKENGGLSDARNVGLKISRGKYILFIDSDDYIENDSCGILVALAEKNNLDIVTGKANKIENDRNILMNNFDGKENIVYSGQEYLKNQLRYNVYPVVAWINLYRRDFLLKNNLFFNYGIYHEDTEWTPRVFLKAERVCSSRYNFYNYIIRKDSITKKASKEKHSKDLMIICNLLSNIFVHIDDHELKCLLNNKLAQCYLIAFRFNYQYYIKNEKYINKKFPLKYAHGKNKFWAIIFAVDLRLYYYTYQFRLYIKEKLGI